jgi:hypothetical protein
VVSVRARRAETAKLREIAKKAPPLPAASQSFWLRRRGTGVAELAHLWLSIRCECRAGGALPLRYLAASHGWKIPLSGLFGGLECTNCGERPLSVDLVNGATTGAAVVRTSGTKHPLRLMRFDNALAAA